MAPNDLQPHYGNGVFGNVYLLALDNTKRLTLPAPHCSNRSCRYFGAWLQIDLGPIVDPIIVTVT